MMWAFNSEWIKIRTARANLVLAAIAVGLPLIIGSLIAVFGNFDNGEGPNDTFGNTVLGPASITVLLCGVLGVLCIGQEYRHSTIRTTFVAMPRRSVVLIAKTALTAVMGAGLGLLGLLLNSLTTSIIFKVRDITAPILQPGDNVTASIGLIVFCALFALWGLGLGAIIRQPAGAIPTLLLWPLLVENLIGGLLSLWTDKALKFLPFRTGFRLIVTGEDFGSYTFGRLGSGLYFGIWAVALVAFGCFLVSRRDA
jgi:ABC-2 type transport system permease protein